MLQCIRYQWLLFVAMRTIIRIAMCTKTKSPNLYNILQILGKDRYEERIKLIIEKLNK